MTRTTPEQRSRIDRSIEIARRLVVVLCGATAPARTHGPRVGHWPVQVMRWLIRLGWLGGWLIRVTPGTCRISHLNHTDLPESHS